MKRIDRYIFREVLIPTLIALIALTGVLVGRQISSLLEFIVRWSPSPSEMWALVAALTPPALTFTIPTAVLVGVLTGFGRMSSDSESVAFRAVGLSTWAILRPVLFLGVLAWTANLVLTVWIVPSAVTELRTMTEQVRARQMALELQPRVFNEELGGRVLFVQDVSPDGRDWSGVFFADESVPDQTELILAESGRLIGDGNDGRYEITLTNVGTHRVPRLQQNRYTGARLETHSLPLSIASASGGTNDPAEDPLQSPTGTLWSRIQDETATYTERVEFHRRLALPFACLAFALIGFPLGLSTHRGGRSMGLVIAAFLMLVYYMFFIGGTSIAENAQLSPFIGTWGANLAFALIGIFLLWRCGRERGNRVLDLVLNSGEWVRKRLGWAQHISDRLGGRWTYPWDHHPKWFRTLDVYTLKAFWFFFGLILSVFVSLFVVVTWFELLSDIVENDAGVGVVAGYFLYLMPQFFYWFSGPAVLVAVLVSLGTLTKTNETLAVKAGAISLYRLSLPLLLMAGLLSAGTYVLQDFLLPHTNRQQDSYRNTIKGKAPQSLQNPLTNWMEGSDGQIHDYTYFDSEANIFYDINIYSLTASPFSLSEWTAAERATWDGSNWTLINGWTRMFDIEGEVSYESFPARVYTPMSDTPDYFKKEVRVASQMTYPELRTYIDELATSGFDVRSLTVDLNRKLSWPAMTLIMAIIAIPFSFSTGRRGSFFGIGISIVIAISYWGAFEVFDKLGGISQLSPMIAAWFPNLIFGLSGFWLLLRVRT